MKIREILPLSLLLVLACCLFLPSTVYPADAPTLDAALIERLTGAKGALDAAEGVFKVSVPRTDLDVRVGGMRLHPRQGLTSWAAFQRAVRGALVMGDLVLLESQVNPVMSVALDNGL